MPLNVDATWSNAPDDTSDPAFDALDLRLADAALVAGAGSAALVHGGITPHSTSSLAVSVDGSDVVTVQAGAAVIPCDAIAAGGVYRVGLSAAYSEALTARSASNPRIDLVVLRMLDTDVVGAHTQRRARLEIIAGVPASSPAVPAKPSMAIELARITVPQTGGGAATINSTKRTFAAAAGGELLVTTAAELPATAAPWQRARTLDKGGRYVWTGAAWRGESITRAGGVSLYPANTAIPDGWPIITQSASVVVTPDASGLLTLTLPEAFPNGLLALLIVTDNQNANPRLAQLTGSPTLSQATVIVRRSGDTGLDGSFYGAIRLSYIATGW